METITICIIVVIAVLFLAVIYLYKELGEKTEAMEGERAMMETRFSDEISDLKKVVNKATAAAASATSAANEAALANQVKEIQRKQEGFTLGTGIASRSNRAPPGAALRLGNPPGHIPGLPPGFSEKILEAQEKGKGAKQDLYEVAEEMYDPERQGKMISSDAVASVAPKNRVVRPDDTGMQEAQIPASASEVQSTTQMFATGQGSTPTALPGINYEAISQDFSANQEFLIDYDIGGENMDSYLNLN